VLSANRCLNLEPLNPGANTRTRRIEIELEIQNLKATNDMEPACPGCSQQLPEAQAHKYRFCPYCEAGLAAEPKKFEDARVTTPPDLTPRHLRQAPENRKIDPDLKPDSAAGFASHDVAPQPTAGQPRPALKPPDSAPPPGFFRTPAEPIKPSPPAKNRNKLMLAVLILLGVIILIIGGLLSF
jgi:hypothetical protein